MNFPQWLQYTLTASLGICAAAALLGVAYAQFRKGNRQERIDEVSSNEKLTSFWKEQAEGYKIMMTEKDSKNQLQINDLTRQVGELRGQLNAETKQKTEYLAILQGKDESNKTFVATMLSVAEQAQSFMKNQGDNNLEVARILKEIHAMAKAEHDRDFKVEATVTKQ